MVDNNDMTNPDANITRLADLLLEADIDTQALIADAATRSLDEWDESVVEQDSEKIYELFVRIKSLNEDELHILCEMLDLCPTHHVDIEICLDDLDWAECDYARELTKNR